MAEEDVFERVSFIHSDEGFPKYIRTFPYNFIVAGVVSTGVSSQHRSENRFGNYAFVYDEGHATGRTFRRESGSHGVKIGSYGLRDTDGRIRTVNYVADALEFRAQVSTNEPGTALYFPAAALYNDAPVARVAVATAPVVTAASYAAPVAVVSPALAAPAVSAVGPIAASLIAPAQSYATGLVAASLAVPVIAKAALPAPAIPSQYAANVFVPSGTSYAW
ncbi:hypothetical protein BIW11_02561 [Tropilaelaps mercedesae]|uniref:Cuticle protein 14-like n=1 Tax=Tropilaelaps mercedesae TaxID=418985 RepID=A0A1V9Y0Y4_9ACAR|nr:hypothetical protein BIW11_02561 [Tropilaelaps mercedesae]